MAATLPQPLFSFAKAKQFIESMRKKRRTVITPDL